ncbi:MAG: hypothetical protein IT249_03895 [Chitinophagaceae bacterium]|nr:hypothetical protein [Chitinophagaceae bacterium]
MRQKLAKLDSSKAAEIFGDSKKVYEQFSQKLNNIDGKVSKAFSGEYLPYLDSLQGSLGFLKDAKNIISKSKDIKAKLGASLQQVKQLQNKLQEAGDVKAYLLQRQEQLKAALANYTNLAGDFSKYLKKYQQQLFYYSREIQECREILNDPGKLVSKVLQTLQTIPQFQKFMGRYSMLAGIFAPAESASVNNPLLPTRDQVLQLIQQQIGSGGSNAQQLLGQQLQQAQNELSKLKDKFSEMGISPGGDMAMPSYKVNQQKTKTFLRRIEFGGNFQSQKATNYFPVTTDFAATAGYKIDDTKIIGIGISGKIGWGEGWKHIKLSGQGAGARFFIEWKAKGNFWLTGGAEMNYQRPIQSFELFKNYKTWNKSGLIGVSRKYSVSKKLKGNMQILYDFLHQQHTPPTPAFIWRVGYNF